MIPAISVSDLRESLHDDDDDDDDGAMTFAAHPYSASMAYGRAVYRRVITFAFMRARNIKAAH